MELVNFDRYDTAQYYNIHDKEGKVLYFEIQTKIVIKL